MPSRGIKNQIFFVLKGLARLDSFLNISNVVHIQEEFKKFKLIVLNKGQYALFNFISNDLITLEEFDKFNYEMVKLKEFSNNKEELLNFVIDYYQNQIKGKRIITSMDEQLINLLDDDLKHNLKRFV